MSNWQDSVEVFYRDISDHSDGDCWADSDGDPLPSGWYYWSCFPGCIPESDPFGPFDSKELAWADAKDQWSDDNEELSQ